MSIEKTIQFIRKYDNFLISSHVNMEGDALGSEISFYLLLKKLGKKAVILNEDNIPYGYDFMPGLDAVRKYSKNMEPIKFDCFVTLDCSDLKRTGEVYTINKDKPILNIDHHVSNSYLGTVNWVKPECSCSCEQVYELFKKMKIPLDKDSALAIYVGILTDTGCFKYSNTNSNTHKITADLVSYGINVSEIYKKIYCNVPYNDLKLLSVVLHSMQKVANGKVVYFEVKKEALQKKISIDLSEQILSFGRSLKDVEVVLLFKENLAVGSEVRVNFRSQGKIDVNKVASYFGGGGHKTASGCTIKQKIEVAKRKVLLQVKKALNESNI